MLARTSLFYREKDHPLLQKGGRGKRALVIFTGEKRLVGGLWHRVINAFVESVGRYQAIVVVGAKGGDFLKEEKIPILKSFTNNVDIPQEWEVERITNYILNAFTEGIFSQVDMLYPRFVSLAKQQPSFIAFLPFTFPSAREGEIGEGIPIFEPSKQQFFNQLLQKKIGAFVYKIVLETKLSELSARTVAMEQAATETEHLIRRLTLDYAKERRRIITQKQLESFACAR
jgi:F-type H+-transporting ATPase subunit gamma